MKADKEVDRCRFPFLYLLEYDSCKSHIFLRYELGVLVMFGYVSSDQSINMDRGTM